MTIPRLRLLGQQAAAVLRGHVQLFREEMAENTGAARSSARQITVGTVIILASTPLLLAGMALLLTVVLVRSGGWDPLTAGAFSTLLLAAAAGVTGWLMTRAGGAGLKAQPKIPVKTIQSLRRSATALTSPIPQPELLPAMNTNDIRDSVNRAADSTEDALRRARNSFSETLYSLGKKIDGNPLIAAGLAWLNTMSDPKTRRTATNALSAASRLPLRYPVPTVLAGAGLGWLAWEAYRRRDIEDDVRSGVKTATEYGRGVKESAGRVWDDSRETLRDRVADAQDFLHRWADDARDAGTAVAERATRTAQDARERVTDAARNAVNGARDMGGRVVDDVKDRAETVVDYARKNPGATLAGVFVLGIVAASFLRPRN